MDKLVIRFVFPDGRLTALIAIDNDWKVEVFASRAAAEEFAKEHNLQIEEMAHVDP